MADTKAKWYKAHRHASVPSSPRPGREGGLSKPPKSPYRPKRPVPAPKPRPQYVPRPGWSRTPVKTPGFIGPIDPRVVPESPARPVSPEPSRLRPPDRRLRLPGGFGRVLGGIGLGLDLADLADEYFFPNGNPDVPPILPANYVWCNGPKKWPLLPGGRVYGNRPFFNDPASCTIGLPLTGQAAAPYITYQQAFAGSPNSRYWRRPYILAGAIWRDAVAGSVLRVGVAVNPQPAPYRAWTSGAMPAINPNIERWLPTLPDPFPDPPVPEFQIGVGTPLSEGPEGFANPDLPYQLDHAWQWQIGIGLHDYVKPSVPTPVPPAPSEPGKPKPPRRPRIPRVPRVRRRRPRKREKHGKLMSYAAKLGIALYKALDGVSEGAEIVDAVYDALPADVRKRWEKERFPDAHWVKDKNTGKWVRVGIERPGDNFGQYGIDGADWKLQALYYNWHRVDYEQAVVNIFKNELSDKVIGGMHKKLPRNAGAAHSQGEMEFAATLDEWLDLAIEYF